MYSIVLIEDHSIVRFGLKALIEESDKFFVKESFSEGSSGFEYIKENQPDFAIIDLNLPDIPGEIIVNKLFLADVKTKIIILSHQKYIPQISHLITLGILAYVVKDNAAEELMVALESVASGQKYLSPAVKSLLIKTGQIKNEENFDINQSSLTKREVEIAKMISKGKTNAQIAQILSLSKVTVRVHVKNISEKLGLKGLGDLSKIKDTLF